MSSNHSVGAMNLLADALDNAGFSPDDITKLRQFNLKEIKELIYGRAELITVKILEFVGSVNISLIKKFVARDHFVKDTSAKTRVKISYLGENFEEWFLSKTEESITENILSYYKLRKSSVDGSIISELGGEEKAETMLTEMFSLMEMQANGESGALLTNGYANIFYIRDLSGVLRAVRCDWRGDGWGVFACSVVYPLAWGDGHRVFSRNS